MVDGPDRVSRATLNMLRYPDKPVRRGRVRFTIESFGGAATQWIASCLNVLPGVACAHSNFVPPSLPRLGAAGPDDESLWRRPLEPHAVAYFNIVERARPDATRTGTIHAFHVSAGDLLIEDVEFRPVYLLRHPVAQTESVVAQWTHRVTVDARFAESLAHLVERLPAGHIGYLLDADALVAKTEATGDPAHLWRLVAMNGILEGFRRSHDMTPEARIATMETVTGTPDGLGILMAHVTGLGLAHLMPVAAKLMSAAPRNPHRRHRPPPEDVFAAWPAPLRDAFRAAFVTAYGDPMRRLGYDLTFAKPGI